MRNIPQDIFVYSRTRWNIVCISDNRCREYQNTFWLKNLFSQIFCRLWENVDKYRRAAQASDDNMAHARFMPDN